MKVATACKQCRKAKRRCLRENHNSTCVQCLKRHQTCSYTVSNGRPAQIAPKSCVNILALDGLNGVELSHALEIQLTDYYLYYVRDRPHSIFHAPTLREQVKNRTIENTLLLAICAVGSRFSPQESVQHLGPEMIKRAASSLHSNLENVNLESIQTCILLANLYAAELKPRSEAIYFGMAIRMSHIVDLPSANSSDSMIMCETKKRVWWALYMADRWCSSSINLPRLLEGSEHVIDLPLDEAIFHDPDFNNFSPTSRCPTLGIWAYKVMLAKIFGPIQDLNHRLVQQDLPDDEIDQMVKHLSDQLEAWRLNLTPDIRFSAQNVDAHKNKGQGGPFLDLHLGYHHYSTLLFFNYLDNRNTSPFRQHYTEKCQKHAHEFSYLLRISRAEKDCEVLFATVGHMTVVSSSVHLHVLLLGDEAQLTEARLDLISNFEFLMELKRYWPVLSRCVQRLFIFQDSCLRASVLSNLHKVDRWMVRFLVEFALPLGIKSSDDDDPNATDSIDPVPSTSPLSISEPMAQRRQITDDVLSGLY